MELIIQTAITAALKAGEEIMKIYEDPASDFGIEQKADNSPLTIADKRANDVILSYLSKTPYPIITEECKAMNFSERKSWQTVWIVDPLDGTKEFIKRNGEFTVNIALVINGAPVFGVIYVPVKRTLYYGMTGNGAYKNEDPDNLKGSEYLKWLSGLQSLPIRQNRSGYVVVASRSHSNKETEDFIAEMEKQHGSIELTSIGSSLKICLVAEGTADVYPRFAPTMEWDTAAGHAIAKAAGKEVYQQDGATPLSYNKENLLNPWFIVK